MKIDVFPVPPIAGNLQATNSAAIVIDVLRAASSICTALANGCREIIPVAEPDEAFRMVENFPRPLVLLAGEREGKRINGFDLGNSPKEFQPDVVTGKTIIMTTTNGTRALLWAQDADLVLILSLLNLRSVANFLAATDKDITIICSGQDGAESLEDTVCAGLLVERLQELYSEKPELTDQAQSAMTVANDHKIDLLAMMTAASHGEHLQKIGFADDLEICSRVNALDVVPVFQDGVITAMTRRSLRRNRFTM